MSTILALHAHPDDETLATGGTLAHAAAQGHRVVLVTATDGSLGLTTTRYRERLADVRAEELRAAAAILGVSRVELLGYADSGLGPVLFDDPPGATRFVRAPLAQAVERVMRIVEEERPDVMLSYDANGGYGHPDHVRVHEVGRAVRDQVGVRLLESFTPAWIARIMAPRHVTIRPTPAATHEIDVRPYLATKVEALRAHRSQLESDGPIPRNNAMLVRLPLALLGRVMGREPYTEVGGAAGPVRTTLW